MDAAPSRSRCDARRHDRRRRPRGRNDQSGHRGARRRRTLGGLAATECGIYGKRYPAVDAACYYPADIRTRPGSYETALWHQDGKRHLGSLTVERAEFPDVELDAARIARAPSRPEPRRDSPRVRGTRDGRDDPRRRNARVTPLARSEPRSMPPSAATPTKSTIPSPKTERAFAAPRRERALDLRCDS